MIRAALSLSVAVPVGLLAYGLVAGASAAPDAPGDARPARAPAFDLPLLNAGRLGSVLRPRLRRGVEDGRLDLAELRGVPVMIDVWASWCPSCREAAPVLQRAWREDLRPHGVLLLGLNIRDVPEDAREFLRDLPNRLPQRATSMGRSRGATA